MCDGLLFGLGRPRGAAIGLELFRGQSEWRIRKRLELDDLDDGIDDELCLRR